jgi:hypothetical protein
MGNISSLNNDNDVKDNNISLYNIIDYIAVNYILKSDFNSLKKLTEKEYCDNLVILTSDIIARYLSSLEIDYLTQRLKYGQEVNELDKTKLIIFYLFHTYIIPRGMDINNILN